MSRPTWSSSATTTTKDSIAGGRGAVAAYGMATLLFALAAQRAGRRSLMIERE
jgi:hypothetical protein